MKPFPRDNEDAGSLLSKLGTDSPKPRVKFGGMFCNVEGAYENKTLHLDSYNSSPQSARRHVKTEEKCWSDTFSDADSVSNFSAASGTGPSCDPAAYWADTRSSIQGQIVYQTGHTQTGHNRTHNGKHEAIVA
ncbi:hypothetical protein DPEC_G00031230 [Dallia pectoralis]|uniref:Uncharacterized protein n=1 Tax=Dallia pectoralis TaxID=75939 RepID=A0ACC2HCF9_DALPE|nr:hypothetical protein DPEC_G00031230 [Dallia pectoralis]